MTPWLSTIDLFRRSAEAHAARPAVRRGGVVALSYSGLLDRAAALGGGLRALGIGPGDVVGLALEKSPEFVVGLLGTWWAGAAWLTLDPALPPDRLAAVVGDARPSLAIAGPAAGQALGALGVRGVPPDLADGGLPAPHPAGPDDLAYLVYTSGSTGRPKGVLMPHRGLPGVLQAQIPAFGLGPGCRVLWFLSPSFDASLSDVGTALLSGAELCIEPAPAPRAGPELLPLLGRRGITHWDLPPSLLRTLDPDAVPDSLRTLVIGGEACPPEVARRWARRARVVNVYGPTEATICTSLGVCDPDTWDAPLLGGPLPGVHYAILDDALRPAPDGAPGELAIAAPGLALGYRNLPELTARKFVVRDGVRRYLTGDRVVRRGDGAYAFLGRLDRQVKVRGLLVEPEEVEARLLEHPGVLHASVLKRALPGPAGAGPEGGAREGLVAFLVPRDPGAPPPAPALRRALAGSLPSWMIPRRFEIVAELPRTSSGKVDLGALAERPLADWRAGPTAGEGGAAGVLAEAWAEALGLASVGRSEGFFAQGGDSLGLLEAVAAAKARGLTVPPAWLADGLSIAEIADRLDGRGPETGHGPSEPPPGALDCAALRRDAEGDDAWRAFLDEARARPCGPTDRVEPGLALLTGGTGFFGARLLAELLRRSQARVACLVRAETPAAGLERLREALELQAAGLTPDEWARVEAVPGDLGRPRLGLAPRAWDALAQQADAVYHSGAWVNLVRPYDDLRPANVLGTREAVRLAASGRRKRLHLVSTLSVFVATDHDRGTLLEDDGLADTRRVFGGYAQSKWAAEWLVRAACGAAGPTRIYRLGLLTGDSATGRPAPHDFLTRFFRGLARLGQVPLGPGGPGAEAGAGGAAGLSLDVTPVDYAAAATARLSLRPDDGRDPATFHLANPVGLTLAGIVDAMASAGIRLESVSPERWRERLREAATDPDAAAACLALCRAWPGEHGEGAFADHRTMDLFQATGVSFDRRHADRALAGSGLACPPPDRRLLLRYLGHAFPGRPR